MFVSKHQNRWPFISLIFISMKMTSKVISRKLMNVKGSHTLQFRCYLQGQSPEPKIREYFYYIDHQGMLFLDDAKIKNFTSCFKERKFLIFFFKQLRINESGRYPEFPYISLCGREKNYVRCDDFPFVYTHVVGENICYGHANDELKERFLPDKIHMNQETGRVYHPAPSRAGGTGLIKSSLAIDFSTRFQFGNGERCPPTHFTWQGIEYKLQLQ